MFYLLAFTNDEYDAIRYELPNKKNVYGKQV